MTTQHPFASELSKLSQEEIEKRHNKLLQRYHIARRMNMDQNVIRQLEIMLDDIEGEKRDRIDSKNNSPEDSDPVVIDTDRDLL